jgi:large subunit ribosomal protein L4
VDKKDEFPRNLTAATMTIMHVNLMPAYGLNVHDMLKHKTLVLTKAAVEHIEEKLLFAQRRLDIADKCDSANTTSKKGVEMPYHGSGTLS